MSVECCQISWLAFGIFFAFTQGIVAIILASSPQDDERAIQYTRVVTMPKNVLVWVGGISLAGIITATWLYFLTDTKHGLSGYIISGVITILGILTFVILCIALHRIWQIRLSPKKIINNS